MLCCSAPVALASDAQLPESEIKPIARAPDSLRIAIAQLETRAGNIPFNLESAMRAIDRAEREGADVLILPEAHLSGYFALDLFENSRFLAACQRAAQILADYTRDKKVAVGFGYPRLPEESSTPRRKPFNSMAFAENGKIVHVVDKHLMAGTTRDCGQGDIFWDDRYFQRGKTIETFSLKGHKIGVCICEDMFWTDHDINVPEILLQQRPDILIIPAASPWNTGKFERRLELLKPLAERFHTEIMYVNTTGTYDGYEGEVATDGRSFVLDRKGTLRALAKGFEEDFLIHDTAAEAPPLQPHFQEIEEIHAAIVQGIRSYFRRNGCTKAIVGSSGGIDSAVVIALAAEALGPENVVAVTMPSHITSGDTLKDAAVMPQNLGVSCHVRPISAMYKAWLEGRTEAGLGEPARFTKQNVQARMRLQILMEYSNDIPGALVLNTTNKTEAFMGYGTLYADLAGAIGPIMDVNKERVYALARYINDRHQREVIPCSIIDRAPTAELEPGQTDEANLPAPYSILAPLVDKIIEEEPSPEELCTYLRSQFALDDARARTIVEGTLKLIQISEHKRRQVPPGDRITPKAAGAGRRKPLSKDAFNELTIEERLSELDRRMKESFPAPSAS